MNNEQHPVSEVDVKILNILIHDARLSYRQIAKKLNLAVATVMKHVQAMEKLGIIKKYTALIDYEKLGYDIDALIMVRVAKGKEVEVTNKFAHDAHVLAAYDHTGNFDSTIVTKFKNRKQLNNFVKKLQQFPFVTRTYTQLVLKIIKEEPMGIE